ncbi:MAG TPA: dihydroorotase family protein [Thermoplasmata archaeon]|nr:dihydroorotase family protein [Thermoplasmata archaeon]
MSPSSRGRSAGAAGRPAEPPAQVLAGRAFVRGRLQPVEIGIDADGRIESVGRVRDGGARHDVGDCVILPAATDLHVHLREPGGDGESIASGTVEAALGGVTLVGEMPNTDPPVTNVERLEEKESLVRGRAAVDILLYASPSVPRSVPGLASRAGAFKVYLSPTTGIDEVPDPASLADLLRRLSEVDLPVSVHAEDPTRFVDRGKADGPSAWNSHRPPAAERSALELLRSAPDRLRLHAAHVTTAAGVGELRQQGRSFEATAHHLLLSVRSGTDTRFKVNPPLRSEADRSALWSAFARGEVPCLASDHAPHPVDRKSLRFDRAPSGMPGLETTVPLLLGRVRSGELPLEVLLRAACDRPARWFGQPLGRIAPGHRANLLVVDFRDRRPLRASQLHAPCGWTAFEGWEAVFPREHWRDGERIVRDGEYVGRANGRVVVPEFSPAGRARRSRPRAE